MIRSIVRIARLLSLLLLASWCAFPAVGQTTMLAQLDSRLRKGDVQALFDLAPYFDSRNVVEEHLGYHVLPTQESAIAQRLVQENCAFTAQEITLSPAISARAFGDFLNRYRTQIRFSPLAKAFLITPLEQRQATVQIRTISPARKAALENQAQDLFGQEWARRGRVGELVARKDPQALLVIAAALYQARTRFDQYPERASMVYLLQLLTGTDIGTENERHQLSWHLDDDYDPTSQLNLLVYLANTYQQYVWSEPVAAFVLPTRASCPLGRPIICLTCCTVPWTRRRCAPFAQLTLGIRSVYRH
ncbi:hypothetical protein [Hymenobacter sp. AT01-02]|uniref:hypothetical protein n=1 Tax=Hymenobacter sp. AT01-02 TaxID=1571877 RepID=UPI0006E398C5|nr:hypothetical protein [Hymenobacter sp. AT01-02]